MPIIILNTLYGKISIPLRKEKEHGLNPLSMVPTTQQELDKGSFPSYLILREFFLITT